MTITSIGYEKTVTWANWAALSNHLGATYSVFGADHFRVSAVGGDRAVSVAPGHAAGGGIYDVSNADEVLNGDAVASGSRWDLVALRRTWSSVEGESATVPVLIKGSSTKAIPARFTNPGVKDDQPLALVRFAAGQSTPQEIIDLRCWHGDGGLVAVDPLVRSYLTRIGTHVQIQGTLWVRDVDSFGNPQWTPDRPASTVKLASGQSLQDWAAAKDTEVSGKRGKTETIDVSWITHASSNGGQGVGGKDSFLKGYLPATFYNKTEIDAMLAGRANADHNHDGRYYTEYEIDSKLAAKAATGHKHSAADITSGTIDLARIPTIPITKGGLGATTVAGARNTLGLGNTAGALPIANGGTGATSRAQAVANLMNDAGWTSFTRDSGWSWGISQVCRRSGIVFVRLSASRGAGWPQYGQVGTLPSGFRPAVDWYVESSNSSGRAEFIFQPDGKIVASGPSNGVTAVTLFCSFPAA